MGDYHPDRLFHCTGIHLAWVFHLRYFPLSSPRNEHLLNPAILTTSGIMRMIRCMCRRVLAALLVLGWIGLSGFDIVEDLDEAPGRAAVSATPDDAAAGSKRGGGGPLSNNIIESAGRTRQGVVLPVAFTATTLRSDISSEFRKHPQLHKLFHVFLI